jgi:hypothetical protein
MAEVDTSSYKLPAQPSALDNVSKIVGLQQQVNAEQQQRINIDKSKLDLVNQGIEYMMREVNSLPPNATPQDVMKVGQAGVNQKFLTPEAYGEFVKEIPTDQKDMAAFKDRYIARALHAKEAINYYAGEPGTATDNRQVYQTRTSPRPGFGVQVNPNPISTNKLPVTIQETQDNPQAPNYGQPRYTAPSGGPLVTPPVDTRPLPVGTRTMPDGSTITTGPNTAGQSPLPVKPPTPAQSVAQRFPGGAAGLPPGAGEAEKIAGEASGSQLAKDRDRAANFQRDVFPLAQAIPALEKLGTKGTGPGTEIVNNLKSFVLSNVPGISEKDPVFNSVPTYDKAKKYLTDFVNQTGNSGTNDKLAAAFAGNPSVGISNAAAVDVAKSALALRRMQQAQIQEFERLGLPASGYSKWVAKQNNEMDPRAFGVDLMSPEAKTKLGAQLRKNKTEAGRFEKSLEIAHGLGFITPSGQ